MCKTEKHWDLYLTIFISNLNQFTKLEKPDFFKQDFFTVNKMEQWNMRMWITELRNLNY